MTGELGRPGSEHTASHSLTGSWVKSFISASGSEQLHCVGLIKDPLLPFCNGISNQLHGLVFQPWNHVPYCLKDIVSHSQAHQRSGQRSVTGNNGIYGHP